MKSIEAMRKNYAAWEIDPQEFFTCTTDHDRMRFLLRFAVLAPSSHNSQPWQFSINDNDGAITILPSKERMLPESDARMRQLYISLGCAVENIIAAAEHFGYDVLTSYPNDNDPAITLRMKKISKEEESLSSEETSLAPALTARRTNRSPYVNEPILPIPLPLRFQGDGEIFINYVSERAKMNALADATLDAIDDAMGQKGFTRELSRYIIHNYSASPTGMPGFTLGIPTFISFIVPYLIRNLPSPKSQRTQNEKLLKNETPTYVVISTINDTPKDWVKTGEVFEYIALRASLTSVATHPMAAGIEIGNHYQRIQTALGITTRPQFFMRIGKATQKVGHSPRLSLAYVVS